jgi:hypothetical protein
MIDSSRYPYRVLYLENMCGKALRSYHCNTFHFALQAHQFCCNNLSVLRKPASSVQKVDHHPQNILGKEHQDKTSLTNSVL